MNVEIVSEALTEAAAEDDEFGKGKIGDVTLRDWLGFSGYEINPDVLVLDLQIGKVGDGQQILQPSLISRKLQNAFSALENQIPAFLRSDGVVIALTSDRVTYSGKGGFDTHGWLDYLQVVNIVPGNQREDVTVFARFPAIERYFEYVEYYEYGLRFNETTINDPEILAEHTVDNEAVAAAVQEFRDLTGSLFTSNGRLVLLPRPTTIDSDIIGLLESLKQIGEFYHEEAQFGGIRDPDEDDPLMDMDYVLRRGETETVEYKGSLPDHVDNLAKELIALANQRGGVIALGIRDDGTVVGLNDIHEVEERVSGLVQNRVDPRLFPRIEKRQYEGRDVLLVRVYRQGPLHSLDGKFYVRVGTIRDKLDWRQIERRVRETD